MTFSSAKSLPVASVSSMDVTFTAIPSKDVVRVSATLFSESGDRIQPAETLSPSREEQKAMLDAVAEPGETLRHFVERVSSEWAIKAYGLSK